MPLRLVRIRIFTTEALRALTPEKKWVPGS
jgi:hypothetical protein